MQQSRSANDENFGLLFRGKQAQDAENPATGKKRGVGLNAAPASSRKVMSNITNQGSSKQGPFGGFPRKALGDITNATPGTKPQQSRKPFAEFINSTPGAQAIPGALAFGESKAAWEDEEVERLAGKGWKELEQEEKSFRDAEIKARVKAVLAPPLASLAPRTPGSLADLPKPRFPLTAQRPHSRPASPLPGLHDISLDFSHLMEPETPMPTIRFEEDAD